MLYLDLGLSTPRRGPVAYLPRWALLAQLPWRGLNRPYAEYRIMPSKMRARRRSRRRTPRRPPGPARRRLYPGSLDRRSGGAPRQSDSALPGHHAGSASGANPGTVRFSLEYRTGPALAETNRAFAFAPFHNARHGGKGVGLRGDGLQLRAGGDLGRGPGGESGPAADQLFPSRRGLPLVLFRNRQARKQGPPVVDQGDDARHDLAALQIVSGEAAPAPLVLQLVKVILRVGPVPVVLAQRQDLIRQ